MAGNAVQQWYAKTAKAAKADPKKAGVLGVLAVVMVLLWVRYLSPAGGPGSAAASLAPTGTGLVSPGSAGSAGRAPGPVQLAQQWAQGRISPVSRNLFAVNYEDFPEDGSQPHAAGPSPDDGYWQQLQKSLDVRADQKKRRREMIESLRTQAAQLHVESVIMGAEPKALVNGQLVGTGDVLNLPDAQFRVVRITPGSIVVEREGVKLEIVLD